MMANKFFVVFFVTAWVTSVPSISGQEHDDAVIQAIKEEGLQRSQVMDVVGWLSDVYGPRLTGSPAIEEAKQWAMIRLQQWGADNVHEERFPFGRGWSIERFHAHMTEPQIMPLIGFPKAWSSSTTGTVTADVVSVEIKTRRDFAQYRGKLLGKIVLPQPAREVRMLEGELVLRMDDTLLQTAEVPVNRIAARDSPASGRTGRTFLEELQQFYVDEGVVAVIDRGSDVFMVNGAPSGSRLSWPTQRTDGGTVFVGRGGSWDENASIVVPSATIAVEHYNRMARLLERGLKVRVEINISARFHEEEDIPNGFNIIGEIPGSDLAHEIVMLGAHFDSTHAATGATDNAAGSAAMMEAVRILKAVGVVPRRTIRIALWGAEEQGLLGSREYVKHHFADRGDAARKPEHALLSAYYNLDNGSGRVRGLWLQDNDAVGTIVEPWLSQLTDLGVSTLGLRSPTGTDHIAFDEVGLPGFQFIQDRLEYNSRTHHSNMDFFDRVQKEDVMQMAIVAAVFAYKTAMLDKRFPRKASPIRQ